MDVVEAAQNLKHDFDNFQRRGHSLGLGQVSEVVFQGALAELHLDHGSLGMFTSVDMEPGIINRDNMSIGVVVFCHGSQCEEFEFRVGQIVQNLYGILLLISFFNQNAHHLICPSVLRLNVVSKVLGIMFYLDNFSA